MITMLIPHVLSLVTSDDGILGLLNVKISEAMKTIGGAGGLAVAAWFVWQVFKRGLAAGAIIIALVVGGLAMWAMTSGITDMKKRIDIEVNGIHQIAPVQTDRLGGTSRGGA